MPTILLVDDDLGIRKAYGQILKGKGYDVIEADSGLQAYEKALAHLPDLILSDISMPGGGGEALLHFVRHHAQLGSKQVVLMTGNPDSQSMTKWMEAGADDFLMKPIALDNLLHCIETRMKQAGIVPPVAG